MSPLAEVVWDRDVDPDGAVTRYLEQTSALLEPYIALALDAPDRVVVTGDRDVVLGVLGALGLPLPPIVGPLPPYAAVVLHPDFVRAAFVATAPGFVASMERLYATRREGEVVVGFLLGDQRSAATLTMEVVTEDTPRENAPGGAA